MAAQVTRRPEVGMNDVFIVEPEPFD